MSYVPARSFVWQPEDAVLYRHILKPYCAESTFPCGECGRPYNEHGWLPKGEGATETGHLICPGMLLLADGTGEYFPVRAEVEA